MKYSVRWVGNITGFGSIDEISRNMALGLAQNGIPVKTEGYGRINASYLGPQTMRKLRKLEYSGPEKGPFIRVYHKYFSDAVAEFGDTDIATSTYMTFETNTIPFNWAERLNKLDRVIVPSNFNIDSFVSGGVDSGKLRVCQHGVDEKLFNPEARPFKVLSTDGYFTFLHVSDFTPRKSITETLLAFVTEFGPSEKVALVFKTYCGIGTREVILKKINDVLKLAGINKHPPIFVVTDKISCDNMPSFYRSFDALVLPSKGEGVGIPYLEAMFCKVPVIGTSVTGQADFLNDNTAFVVVCNDRVPVDCPDQLKYCQMTYLNHLWYLPSIPSLALRMRECKEDAHTRTIKVENAYDVMMQKYTLDKASKQMKSILDEIAEGRIK